MPAYPEQFIPYFMHYHCPCLHVTLSPFLCVCPQEALSVVSEDQSIFESSYGAPAMHMKEEMTSSRVFSQTSKESPEPTEPEWNPAKTEAEHMNGSRYDT